MFFIMGFTDIKITNFKGIDHLEINDIKRVNIFVGKNNSGKTSVLEAIYLITGIVSPAFLHYINSFRGESILEPDDFSLFFHKGDTKKNIQIEGKNKDNNSLLCIKPKYGIVNHSTQEGFQGIDYEYYPRIDKDTNSYYSMSNLFQQIDGKLQPDITQFPTWHSTNNRQSQSLSSNAAAKFTNISFHKINTASFNILYNNGDTDPITKILKKIQPNIEQLTLLSRNRIGVKVNDQKKLIPLNLMGDGMVTICSILCDLYALPKGNILLIDELESGLHYTTLRILWTAILEASKVNDIQLFVTTHSKEVLDALIEADSLLSQEDEIRYYHIAKGPLGIFASPIDKETYKRFYKNIGWGRWLKERIGP